MSANPGTVFSQRSRQSIGSDYQGLVFVIEQLIGKIITLVPVRVVTVANAGSLASDAYVNVQPLLTQQTGNNSAVPHGVINNVPCFKLQGGSNAAILDPAVGDIGLMLVAYRDTSNLIAADKASPGSLQSAAQPPELLNPGSAANRLRRRGFYLGGWLNGAITQYLLMNSAGIRWCRRRLSRLLHLALISTVQRSTTPERSRTALAWLCIPTSTAVSRQAAPTQGRPHEERMKLRLASLLAVLAIASAEGQSVPNGTIVTGQIWTAAQWNLAWQAKVDYLAEPANVGLFGPVTGGANFPTWRSLVYADVIPAWAGTCNSGTFLRGDGSCAVPATGSGTVTSVGMTVPSGLSVSPSTITTAGTFAVTTALSGPIKGTGSGFTAAAASDIVGLFSTCSGVQYLGADGACHNPGGGGTGNVTASGSPTQYQTPVWVSGTAIGGVGPGTTGQAFVSNGAAANPSFSSSLPGVSSVNNTAIPGSATLLVNGGAAGTPSSINLSNGTNLPSSALPGTIAANTSGNAATATTATTAGALSGSPTQCTTALQFATGIAPNGNANCTPFAPAFTGIVYSTGSGIQAAIASNFPTLNQSTTGNAATSTALAATPLPCSSGQAAQGIAANGNATGCFTPAGAGTVTSVSVATANGLGGSVATPTTTPSISIAPTFTGIAYSNGSAFSTATAGEFPQLNQNTSGNASTASALASAPTQCASANLFAVGIAANGNANCTYPTAVGTVDAGYLASNTTLGTSGTVLVQINFLVPGATYAFHYSGDFVSTTGYTGLTSFITNVFAGCTVSAVGSGGRQVSVNSASPYNVINGYGNITSLTQNWAWANATSHADLEGVFTLSNNSNCTAVYFELGAATGTISASTGGYATATRIN